MAGSVLNGAHARKQKYVIRYEDLEEDPAGVFYDFLLSTGVAQKLVSCFKIFRLVDIELLENLKLSELLENAENC